MPESMDSVFSRSQLFHQPRTQASRSGKSGCAVAGRWHDVRQRIAIPWLKASESSFKSPIIRQSWLRYYSGISIPRLYYLCLIFNYDSRRNSRHLLL